ncbi:MAG: 2-keto-4-pentenoate hydratase [Comamonadaceae bacterium]|nr:MAG: 2-keto-4-pentenoate hydratase [Comamonadaceae bacterium]
MNATPDLQAVASALLAARHGGPLPDADAFAAAVPDAAAAFRVQGLTLQALGDDPARCRAWKSGGPSRTAVLTHAPLPSSGLLASGASATHLPLIHRMIEAEVALRLGRDVTVDMARALDAGRWEQALELVDGMAVTIELVDARWAQGFAVPAPMKLADLQCHGGLVMGEFLPWKDRDWDKQSCEVWIGDSSTSYVGTHALGHPGWLLPTWLKHATRDGATVPAGTVVTTGTWCGLLAAAKGDRVRAAFAGIGEASVQL